MPIGGVVVSSVNGFNDMLTFSSTPFVNLTNLITSFYESLLFGSSRDCSGSIIGFPTPKKQGSETINHLKNLLTTTTTPVPCQEWNPEKWIFDALEYLKYLE